MEHLKERNEIAKILLGNFLSRAEVLFFDRSLRRTLVHSEYN